MFCFVCRLACLFVGVIQASRDVHYTTTNHRSQWMTSNDKLIEFLVEPAAISKRCSGGNAKEYDRFVAITACGATTSQPISTIEIEHRCAAEPPSRWFGAAAKSSQFIVQRIETCDRESVSVDARLSLHIAASQSYLCQCVSIRLYICLISAVKLTPCISVCIINCEPYELFNNMSYFVL